MLALSIYIEGDISMVCGIHEVPQYKLERLLWQMHQHLNNSSIEFTYAKTGTVSSWNNEIYIII